MLTAIVFLIVFLALFILYPLTMLLVESVMAPDRMGDVAAYYEENVKQRVNDYNYEKFAIEDLQTAKNETKAAYDAVRDRKKAESEDYASDPEVVAAKEKWQAATGRAERGQAGVQPRGQADGGRGFLRFY